MRSIAKYLLSAFCFGLLFTTTIYAQPKCKIEHYSTEDGLSHDIITYILKDKEGFMWFGTWNGINRFDGHRFVSYRSMPGDQSYLKSGRIDQILEGEEKYLWIKAYDGQIYRFNKLTEQFTPLPVLLGVAEKGKHLYRRILSTEHGNVWIEAENEGLVLITGKPDSLHRYQFKTDEVAARRLPSNSIQFFKEDAAGRVWVGTKKGLACLAKDAAGNYCNIYQGILPAHTGFTSITMADSCNSICFGMANGHIGKMDTRSGRFTSVAVSNAAVNGVYSNRAHTALYATTAAGELLVWYKGSSKPETFSYRAASALYSMYEDKTGNIWIEPEKEGAVRFNPATHVFKEYQQKNNARYNYSGNHFKVFEDNNGLVWVNLKGGGFGYYNTAADEVSYFYNEPNTPNRQFSNIVSSVYYDREGILWLRTDERGIEKITFQRNEFTQHILEKPGVFQSDNEVRGLCQDRKGRLWLGVKGGKLYLLENGTPVHLQLDNVPEKGLGLVYAIMQDRTGVVWLGTKANGLYRAEPVNKEETHYRLSHYTHKPEGQSGPCSDEIYSLLEDGAGRIWVGTFDNGIDMAVVQGNEVRFVHDSHALQGYPRSQFRKIRHMALDSAGRLWLGTTDGLLVVNTANAQKFAFAAYQKIPGDKQSLGNNDIQFVYRDAGNTMWLATSGGGLNRAMGDAMQHMRFQVYTTHDGLPNDYLVSCAEDRQHNLWIATQTGLSKLDATRSSFRNYNSHDGVPKYAFSEGSGIRRADGTLVFGTIKGYLTFDPATIKAYPMQAEMTFTNLQINNADVAPGGKDKLLQAAINYTPSLTLKHNQNIISIDYVVLDYRADDKQSYAFYLKGFDTGWQYNSAARRATYTNLPPGDYVFEVKCMNQELYNNVPAKSILITILPPPWKTWWAYLLYILLAAIVLEVVRRTALTMLRLRHNIAVEKKIAALKLNFFTNVSHELRTPMTLILNPIEAIGRQENLSPQGRQYLEVVRKNASRMSRFLNQLLDLRKLQSGKARLTVTRVELGAFVKSVGDYFTELAREKQIRFKIITDPVETEAWIDIDKVETALYNVVANAFKFTPNGKAITVRVKKAATPGSILIEISDEGAGVPADKLATIFELFYEGEGHHASAGKGTGIGLALSKEMIELHGGNITARNNATGGLTVAITLPVATHAVTDMAPVATEILSAYTTPREVATEQFATENVSAEEDSSEKPFILLVEDNTDLRFFLQSQLLTAGYRVEVAANGQEGLNKAQELLPDLVLSDVMMPVMDGIQMLHQLKTSETTSHIPVILLTARSAVESQIEGLDYGADYYITKPFNHDFLVAAIRNLVVQRKKVLEGLLKGQKTVLLEPGAIQITSQDELFLQKVVAIVEEKMADVDFNIDTVAETAGMSRTAFYKKFKGLTGLAPVEFVRELRLKRAQQYLDADYGNVTEIAYTVGFSNARYFSTCFKAKFNLTPSEYVKQRHDKPVRPH